jgi:hypothetical protein
MADHRHMGQSAHPGRTRAAIAAGGLVAAATITGCSSSLASATTVLMAVNDASVVHADGSTAAAVNGLRLRAGDIVRTGRGGRAELVTRARHVYLGSQASVQVLDGEHQQLRHGAMVVDAQHGSGLSLSVAGLDVSAPAGTALRAERSVTVRLGALAGSSHVVSPAGRSLDLASLQQVVVGGDALPDRTTPLRLTDDDGESHAVPVLVHDDESLTGLARGIDGSGAATARVVTAAWHGPTTRTPDGVARSERVLPVVIAAAGPAAEAVHRYRSAVALRTAGGSWGVVAHLLGVGASGVVDELAVLQRTQKPGAIGNAQQVLAAIAGGTTVSAGGRPGSTGQSGGGTGTGGGGSGGGGGGSNPQPTPSPSSTQQPLDPVSQTVSRVLSLVPTPTSTPTGLLPTGVTSQLPLPLPLP